MQSTSITDLILPLTFKLKHATNMAVKRTELCTYDSTALIDTCWSVRAVSSGYQM